MIQTALILSAVVLVCLALSYEAPLLALAVIVVAVPAVLLTLLLHNALSGIYAAALFRYASTGEAAIGFGHDALSAAFLPKQ